MKRYAVIVAGGKGLRMGIDIPKQFLVLCGKPVLQWSIEAFYTYDATIDIIVVLPVAQISYWKRLCEEYHCTISHRIVEGGKERFNSVQNGLQCIEGSGVVAVHDGVRPLISQRMLADGFKMAEEQGSAVPYVDSVDSLRVIDSDGTRTLDRSKIKRIQTPQIFSVQELQTVMHREYQDSFTDEASVWELSGRDLSFYMGDEFNIKITKPLDLQIAQTVIHNQQ